jgi:hypothetical protein
MAVLIQLHAATDRKRWPGVLVLPSRTTFPMTP